MVIHNLNLMRVPTAPREANAPLIVDSNAIHTSNGRLSVMPDTCGLAGLPETILSNLRLTS